MRFLAVLLGLLFVGADDPFAPENEVGAKAAVGTPKKAERTFAAALPSSSATFVEAKARRGATVSWTLTLQLAPGWHTYPTRQQDKAVEPSKTVFAWPRGPVAFVEPLVEPEPKRKIEEGLTGPGSKTTILEYEGTVVFRRTAVVRPETAPGDYKVEVKATLLICDEKGCLAPENVVFTAPLTVTDEPAVEVDPKYVAALNAPPTDAATPGAGAADDSTLAGFMLTGAFWGFISLLTPCVFPMIPITVSFFLKQSERKNHRPVRMAVIYCATIVTVLTIGAVLLLSVFQAASQHWLTNFALGGLFVFFALSLLGMYEITLPSGLARFTSMREGQGGTAGTVFMALTFSIISFSCVAPFLGGFAALVPSLGNVTEMLKAGEYGKLGSIFGTLTLGALAFSGTFAAPFFFLALFPSLLKTMPRSGAWMNTIKVVMGFLELAAAVKFLRASELLLFGQAQILTYDLSLGLYVALSLVCGLYLLGLYRLPHDHDVPEHMGVPRVLVSCLFIALALYLTPGLFKIDEKQRQRPGGSVFSWLDSFLLPDLTEQHLGNLAEGLKEARDKRRLVFLDFTGIS